MPRYTYPEPTAEQLASAIEAEWPGLWARAVNPFVVHVILANAPFAWFRRVFKNDGVYRDLPRGAWVLGHGIIDPCKPAPTHALDTATAVAMLRPIAAEMVRLLNGGASREHRPGKPGYQD